MARETRSTKKAQTRLSLRNRTVQRLDYVDPSPSKPVRVNRQRPTRGLPAQKPVSLARTRTRTPMLALDNPVMPISSSAHSINSVNTTAETAAETPVPALDNPITPAVDNAGDPPQSAALSTIHEETPVEKPSPDLSSAPTPLTPAMHITTETVLGGAESPAHGDEGTPVKEVPSTTSKLPDPVHDGAKNVQPSTLEHTQATDPTSAGDASDLSKEDAQEPEANQDVAQPQQDAPLEPVNARDALGVSEKHSQEIDGGMTLVDNEEPSESIPRIDFARLAKKNSTRLVQNPPKKSSPHPEKSQLSSPRSQVPTTKTPGCSSSSDSPPTPPSPARSSGLSSNNAVLNYEDLMHRINGAIERARTAKASQNRPMEDEGGPDFDDFIQSVMGVTRTTKDEAPHDDAEENEAVDIDGNRRDGSGGRVEEAFEGPGEPGGEDMEIDVEEDLEGSGEPGGDTDVDVEEAPVGKQVKRVVFAERDEDHLGPEHLFDYDIVGDDVEDRDKDLEPQFGDDLDNDDKVDFGKQVTSSIG
ncbi:hypothetical protein VKT23_009506 [Stygiomarasmius scandens]|uniref:Uncharacterized protein n=1 Tax=Marasmiellus scandens TaxID=2682957 RepID=A0ABR1JEL1_9AGAR